MTKLGGSGFVHKKQWDSGIKKKKEAGRRDLRTPIVDPPVCLKNSNSNSEITFFSPIYGYYIMDKHRFCEPYLI